MKKSRNGKVWIDYLYPMNFSEFLKALGEEKLLKLIEENYYNMTHMLEATHKKAINLDYDYMCIGGMPMAILDYIENGRDVLKTNDDIHRIMITSYLVDMAKYTENTESIKNNKIYNSIPAQLGKENKKFKYSLIEKSARSREYESSIDWLISSNMLLKCQGIKMQKIPLKVNTEDNFKLYLSDIGILRVLAKIDKNEILLNKNMIYKGVLAENYVAEILYAKNRELYYWQLGSQYEVDFLINVDGDVIPVEVKASDNTTSNSLNYYIKRFKPEYSIRIFWF